MLGVTKGIFSDYNIIKLEINFKIYSRKSLKIWEINKWPLNTLCVKEEITEAIRKYFELNNNKVTIRYNLWEHLKQWLEAKCKMFALGKESLKLMMSCKSLKKEQIISKSVERK